MYKIGEFSKITNLTVKALRYYDKAGILVPSGRDSFTGYRYYNEQDFQKAALVTLLRDFDFSIREIKEVLESCHTSEDLSCYLQEKQQQILKSITAQRSLIQKMIPHINSVNPSFQELDDMDYIVEEKTIQAVSVAAIRFKGCYQDVGKQIKTLYQTVKNKATGTPFCLYYDESYQEEADIDVCLPVTGVIAKQEIVLKELPDVSVISTLHKGPYSGLNLAYKALLDYAKAHTLQLKTPSREFYHKGPGMIFRGNDKNYLTEVALVLQEGGHE